MHLFLYQANRHEPTNSSSYSYSYRNNRSRYKQGTIRGDFDLELLKRGIKGRYKILPHGEHEFQKALVSMDLQEELYGHIVQIEQASNAIWFKLNYDQVGKNVTKYIGGWRDLDPTAIENEIQEYKLLKLRKQDNAIMASAIRNHHYNTTTLLAKMIKSGPHLDNLRLLNSNMIIELETASKVLSKEADKITKEINKVQDRVKEYLKERKF